MTEAETLLAQAVAAVNAGELATAADRFERASAILGMTTPADAVSALESAARLRLMLDDPQRATAAVERARTIDPKSARIARVHAEIIDKTGELPARRQAWQVVVELGDRLLRQVAHIQLGGLARAANDHAAAAGHFEAAIVLVDATDDPTLASELWLELAMSRSACQDQDAADAALARSEAALPADDQGLRARITGHRGVIALARGDATTALTHAESARAQAVERNDALTYLAAASLIAMIHEQAGRLVDAYDTYVRTRESLGDLLGPQGKELAQPAIQLFEERLGPDAFKAVWNEWVARRRAAKG